MGLTLCLEIVKMRSAREHLEIKTMKSLGECLLAGVTIRVATCSAAAGDEEDVEEGGAVCCTSSVCSSSSSPACWGSWEDIPGLVHLKSVGSTPGVRYEESSYLPGACTGLDGVVWVPGGILARVLVPRDGSLVWGLGTSRSAPASSAGPGDARSPSAVSGTPR